MPESKSGALPLGDSPRETVTSEILEGRHRLGKRPERVTIECTRSKTGHSAGQPRERLSRSLFVGKGSQHTRARARHARPRRRCHATKRLESVGRSPEIAQPPPVADRCGRNPRKRLTFSRTRCHVSIRSLRRLPTLVRGSAGRPPRTRWRARCRPADFRRLPRANAGSPKTKNGTSAPSSAPMSISVARDKPSRHRRFRPRSTVAASELPPPRPAPMGMRLSTPISTPRGDSKLAFPGELPGLRDRRLPRRRPRLAARYGAIVA